MCLLVVPNPMISMFATACLPGEGPFVDTSLRVTHLTEHFKAKRNCRR